MPGVTGVRVPRTLTRGVSIRQARAPHQLSRHHALHHLESLCHLVGTPRGAYGWTRTLAPRHRYGGHTSGPSGVAVRYPGHAAREHGRSGRARAHSGRGTRGSLSTSGDGVTFQQSDTDLRVFIGETRIHVETSMRRVPPELGPVSATTRRSTHTWCPPSVRPSRQDVARIGALPTVGHHQTLPTEARHHQTEKQSLGIAIEQATTKLLQDRVIESWIVESSPSACFQSIRARTASAVWRPDTSSTRSYVGITARERCACYTRRLLGNGSDSAPAVRHGNLLLRDVGATL
jgi:hypothetical protein